MDALTPQGPSAKLIPAKEPTRSDPNNFVARTDSATYAPYTEGTAKATGEILNPTAAVWNSRFNSWREQFTRTIWPDVQRYWSLYRQHTEQVLPRPKEGWRDDVLIPTAFKIIEAVTPRQVLGLWGGPDWLTVEGTAGEDQDSELAIKTLIETHLRQIGKGNRHHGNFIKRNIDQLRYTNIVGHSWGKLYWKEHDIVRKGRVPITQPDGTTALSPEMVSYVERRYRGLEYFWLPITSVAVDMSGNYRWHIEIVRTSIRTLERENESFKAKYGTALYPELDALRRHKINKSLEDESQENMREPQGTELFPTAWPTDPLDQSVELWLCYDNFEGTLTKLADRAIVLDEGLSPTPDGQAPLIPLRGLTVPGVVYGDSLLRYVLPMVMYQSRIARARGDEILLNVYQHFIARADVVKSLRFTLSPGGVTPIAVDPSLGDQPLDKLFSPLARRPVFQEAYTEDGYRQQQAEAAAGADALSMGVEATQKSRDVTAQEVSTRTMQGQARTQLNIIEAEVNFKKTILEMAFDLIKQNLTQEEQVRIVGPDGVTQVKQVSVQDLERPFDIQVGGGLYEQTMVRNAGAIQELLALTSQPNFAQALNPQEVIAEWLKARGFKNPRRFLVSQEKALESQAQDTLVDALGQQAGAPVGGMEQGAEADLLAALAGAGGLPEPSAAQPPADEGTPLEELG